jgi:DNA end-binding protein Ku
MVDLGRHAVGQVTMHGRQQLVLLRPVNGLLTMTMLCYDSQVTKPATFEGELTKTPVEPEELKLAKTLIEASTAEKFDIAKYKDDYTEKLTQLIEAKVAGKEIVAPPVHEQAQIINLMDALRQSVAKTQKETGTKSPGKPPKKVAPSVRKQERGARKQKSG